MRSEVRMSINFAGSIRRVNGLNGPKKQEVYNINVLYNKIIVDLSKAIMNFAKHFLNFSTNAMILYLNSLLDFNISCTLCFRNQTFMATKCTNQRTFLTLILFQCSLLK